MKTHDEFFAGPGSNERSVTDAAGSPDRISLCDGESGGDAAISEREQSDELRARLAAIVESSDDAIVGKTLDGIITSWNGGAERIFGYTAEEALGQHISLIIPEDRKAEEDEVLARLRRGERVDHFETERRAKDGRKLSISLTVSPIKNSEGRVIGASKVARDITHLKQVEIALRESEERFRQMADSAPVMVWVTDPDGLCTYLNRCWYDFTGQTAEAGLGERWLDTVHPDDQVRVRADFFAVAREHAPFQMEYRLRRTGGEYRWIIAAAAPRFDASGRFLGYIASGIDITERKEGEETLKKAQQQSEQLNGILESRVAERTADLRRIIAERERLQDQLLQAQKMESVGTLASGVAHDFNNLLNIILSYATIMRLDGKNPDRISEGISIIEETVKRGATLVQQLMALGRKTKARFAPVRFNSLAEKLTTLLTETFSKTIVITLDLQHGLPAINGDENQLHQALLNLCVNARDAMPQGGRIAFQTGTVSGAELRSRFPEAVAQRYVAVSVSDTGSGMDEATQRRIFEPFFTTKPVGTGTGLGLAVVYGIVQNHGGFVEVRSRTDHGTTFFIYLPVAQQADGRTAETRVNDNGRAPAGRGETILFVDDEEQQLKVMRTFLEIEGYEVLGAKDGVEALEIFKQRKDEIAVTVLDLGLPKVGGWQALEQIREIDNCAKVLLATGFISPEMEAEMAQGELCGVIAKPYRVDELLEKISQAIHPSER